MHLKSSHGILMPMAIGIRKGSNRVGIGDELTVNHVLDQLTRLAEGGRRLNKVRSFEELSSTAFDLVKEIFQNQAVAILLKNPQDGTLSIAAARGYDRSIVKTFCVKPGQGITGDVFATGQPQLITETINDPRYIPGVPQAVSEMSVPLRDGDDIVGVLDMESEQNRYTSNDLALFMSLGEHIAAALKKLQLKDNVKERARRLVAISKAGQSLASARDLTELLERILESMQEALGLDTCSVQLWDEDKQHLVIKAAKGYAADIIGTAVPRGKGVTGKVAEDRRPSIIPDVKKIDDYVPSLPNSRSELAVPIVYRQKMLGVLGAEHLELNRFDQTDLLHATIFADQVAGALGNATLAEELEEVKRETGLLFSRLNLLSLCSAKLSEIHDLKQLLEEILSTATQVLKFETIAVLLPDESGLHLRVHRASGSLKGTEGKNIPIESSIVGEVYRSGYSVLIPEVSKEPRYIPGSPNGRSELAVPLKVGEDVVGVLDTESVGDVVLSESEQHMLEALASQAATAVRNARNKSELARREHRLTLIHKAVCSLNSRQEPEAVIGRILELAREALDLENVALLTPDEEGTHLTVRKAINYGPVEGMSIPIGQGFVGKLYAEGRAGVLDDIKQSDDYIPGTPGARCEMAAPLSLKGEIIGMLDAEAMEPYSFSTSDLGLFRIFASQMATALKNSQMVSELKKRERCLALVTEATRALNTIHETDTLVARILESAQKALNLDRCALLLFNSKEQTLEVDASVGYGDIAGLQIPLGEGITGAVAATGKPILVTDTTKDPRYVDGAAGGLSEMAAPLRFKDEILGVLDTESAEKNAFTEGDLNLFATFAAQAAVAISNARLFQGLESANEKLTDNIAEMARLNSELEAYATEIASANKNLETQVKNLTTIHEAGKTITASLDLDTTLQTILAMTSAIIGSTAGAIKLIDEETKELKTRAEAGTISEITDSWSIYDLPLKIGDKTIGVFELVRKASETLGPEEQQLLETMASQAAIAIENARLFENTQRIYYETLKSLASALEARDDYTRGHSERVASLAQKIAKNMGLGKNEQLAIFNAALLHDIGKIGIRDEILLAPRKLTETELATIEQHPTFGNTILTPLKFLGQIRSYVKHHHERWDGNGYPDRCKGEEIPLASRIIAVADAFDAMTSQRPYREQKQSNAAIQEIEECAGSQFDPEVVASFVKIVKK